MLAGTVAFCLLCAGRNCCLLSAVAGTAVRGSIHLNHQLSPLSPLPWHVYSVKHDKFHQFLIIQVQYKLEVSKKKKKIVLKGPFLCTVYRLWIDIIHHTTYLKGQSGEEILQTPFVEDYGR